MKKLVVLLLLAAVLALPTQAMAKSNVDARIDKLEQEIQDLKAQQTEDEKKTSVKAKFPVELYGFVAAQVFYGDSQTVLYTSGAGSITASSAVANEAVLGNNDGWMGITPQNSRIGLNWTGTKVGKTTKIGGKVEMDFLNPGGGASPRLRMRLAYLNLFGENWELRAGQDWDLFSPLNTKTLSLGSNLWFQGNLGFRRPQVRFTYTIPCTEKDKVKLAISANNPSNLDTTFNNGNTTGIPYGEALVQYNHKMANGDLVLAVSGTAGAHRNANKYDKMWGIAGSLHVPLHKFFTFSGEFQYGKELGNFLTYAGTTNQVKSVDAWAQISSRWLKKLETNLGYGIEDAEASRIVAGAIDRNQIGFFNFKFYPVEAFYFGMEYNYMKTNYKGTPGSSEANVIMTNFVYSF